MRNLIITLTLILLVNFYVYASEDDDKIVWTETNQQTKKIDFTPNDMFIIAWTNQLQIWNALSGEIGFSIPTETTGDYNFNNQLLVFVQDSTPKLLKWQTREVVEGFQKEAFRIDRIRTAKSKNEFMALGYLKEGISLYDSESTIYFWDINSKLLVDSLEVSNQFEKDDYTWRRAVLDFDYIGNNDEFLYVKFDDYNNRVVSIPPNERRTNYFYHIYDRNTKELVDSLFVFQDTKDGAESTVDKMFVMNDRAKIAWNNKDGIISFYNIAPFKFENSLNLNFNGEVNEMKFSNFENLFYISRPNPSKYLEIYNYAPYSIQNQFIFTKHLISNRVAFSSNNSRIAFSGVDSVGNDIIGLFDLNKSEYNFKTKTNDFKITPNPSLNNIRISYEFNKHTSFKLSFYDLTGREIENIDQGYTKILDYSIEYRTNNLAPGTYIIKLDYELNSISQKFIKE